MVKLAALLLIFLGVFALLNVSRSLQTPTKIITSETMNNPIQKLVEVVAPKVSLQTPPSTKILHNDYHIFQSFNNCGPAALSMALSYYGINKSQAELGQDLRPYQIPSGDNDDKSVTLEELAEKSKGFNLVPYHRPNGDIEKIKLFITYDIPVITRTYLKDGEDVGHYRVIKGYTPSEIIQDDSLQGKNLRYSFDSFNSLWEDFSFEYLVLVPKEKIEIAEAILGEDRDETAAWRSAVRLSEDRLNKNPNDTVARFNLSVALYEVSDYKRSVEEFEKVENKLSFRTLWYQIEPIKSYYELGNYQRVFQITDRVLNYHNRAFSELYLLRGEIYKKQGDLTAARSEFEKAVLYNRNLKSAQDALNAL